MILYSVLTLLFFYFLWRKFRSKRVLPCGCVVAVTGANRGLGRALALRYAREKCTVIAIDVDDSHFAALEIEVRQLGGECVAVKCDLTKQEDVSNCISLIERKFSSLDLLICNAGVAQKANFDEMSFSRFRHTLEVNFFSTVFLLKKSLEMKNPPTQIAVISSILAFGSTLGTTEYAASKAALHSFLSSFRLENYEKGRKVTITEVCPWQISTEMFSGYGLRGGWCPALSVNYVAESVYEGVCAGKTVVVVPWYMWYVFSLAQQLPTQVYDWVVVNMMEIARK